MSRLELQRQTYRPNRIVALFVGESPPHGGTFFYNANSMLYHAMKEAFECADDFLAEFKGRGFFLDDLVQEPINHFEPALRDTYRLAAVPPLARRIADYDPSAIVVFMCAIKPMVSAAMRQANLDVPLYVTAFPGRFHREPVQAGNGSHSSKAPAVVEVSSFSGNLQQL